MKKFKILIWYSLIMVLLTSCFDDQGNYDYDTIGEAIITIPEVVNGKYIVEQYDVLKLKPEIKYEGGTTEADYDFQWLKYLQNPSRPSGSDYAPADVIGNTKDLEYTVNDNPNDFWLVLKVTNKESKVVTDYRFEFIVTSLNGLIILDEDANGNGDLQVLRAIDFTLDLPTGITTEVIRNYFSSKNNGEKLKHARFVGYGVDSKSRGFFIFTDEGMYWTDPGTYVLMPEMTYASFLSPVPEAPSPECYLYNSKGNRTEMVIDGGDIYSVWWANMMATGRAKTYLPDKSSYEAAPFIAPITVSGNNNSAVMYDKANGRYLTMDKFGKLTAPSSVGGIFDTGDMGTDLELVAMGEGMDGSTSGIFKQSISEEADDIYIYQASFVTSTPVPMLKIKLNSLEGIDQATVYAFGTRGNFMYYNAGNKVYHYRYSKSEAEPWLTLGANERVTDMLLYVNHDNADYDGKILFVATENSGAGKLYKISINEMTGVMNGEPEVFDGFGVIKDLFYKQ